jgi:hypothetical protein
MSPVANSERQGKLFYPLPSLPHNLYTNISDFCHRSRRNIEEFVGRVSRFIIHAFPAVHHIALSPRFRKVLFDPEEWPGEKYPILLDLDTDPDFETYHEGENKWW